MHHQNNTVTNQLKITNQTFIACNQLSKQIVNDGDENSIKDYRQQSNCCSNSSSSNNEKIANIIDCDESQKLLMHLDVDENCIGNGTSRSNKKLNNFELKKPIADNDKQRRHSNDNNNHNHSNSKTNKIDNYNQQSGHNDIEFDSTLISPTNPFRLDFIQFERCNSKIVESKQTKPNNCNEQYFIKDSNTMNINETNQLNKRKNRYNDIKYQRNAKSLGYLIECSCSSSINCKCLLRKKNRLDLRRTKSSTGINDSNNKWNNHSHSNEHENDNMNEMDVNLGIDSKKSNNTMASIQTLNNNASIESNSKLRLIFGKTLSTNKVHSMNGGDSNRNMIKEFVQQRWLSLRLLSQQKFQTNKNVGEKHPETITDSVNFDNVTNAKHTFDKTNDTKANNNNVQGNSYSRLSIEHSAFNENDSNKTIDNNDDEINGKMPSNRKSHSNELLKDAKKSIDECKSSQTINASPLMIRHKLIANENWKSNSCELQQQHSSRHIHNETNLMENKRCRNDEHDFVLNATKTNTNPFLEHESIDIKCQISKIDVGEDNNNINNNMERCKKFATPSRNDDKIRASNDAEETISNQFITNDGMNSTEVAAVVLPCKSNRFNDNEKNISNDDDKKDLFYNKSYSSRVKHKQKHDKMTNNLLDYEDDDANTCYNDTNQWDNTLTMANRSATLMKYGNKRKKRKDCNKDTRKRNKSTDNLALIDTIGQQQHHEHVLMRKAQPNQTSKIDKETLRTNLNYFNELEQQLISDEKQKQIIRPYSSYVKNQRQNINTISDIPTCPFQRQDYTKPDDENQCERTNSTQKKSKKDLLLNFALQKGKYLSNSMSRGNVNVNEHEHVIDGNRSHKMGNFVKSVNSSNKSISGATHKSNLTISAATSMNQMSSANSYSKKFNMSYANRMAHYSNNKHQLHYRHKDDKTYFDKTKKSLLKIGQKCGLKLNSNLNGGTSMKKYECASLREPLTNKLDADTLYRYEHVNKITEKFPYKSYRSEIDLTKNLHYLDAFLNENFDKLSMAKEGCHSIGKYTMSSSQEQQTRNQTLNEYEKRGHRHRAQSYSKVSEFDSIDDYKMYANTIIASTNNDFTKNENSLENNYNTSDALLSASSLHIQRELTINNTECLSNINDDLNSVVGQQHQQQNQYAISSSTSDSFSTFASFKQLSTTQKSPTQYPTGSTVQNNQKFAFGRDSVVSTANLNAFSCAGDKSASKSHTTSSSLSSSDYASVYSPCSSSQLNEMNPKCLSGVNTNQTFDITPTSDTHYHGNGPIAAAAASTKINNELMLKQKRYSSINAQYHKRNSLSTNNDLSFDERLLATNYFSDARPLNCIDGLRIQDDDEDNESDTDFEENIANDFNDASNYVRGNKDKMQSHEKISYKYENQLSYHEDYLQHYYNKSIGKRISNASSSSTQIQTLSTSPMTHSQHSASIHLNYDDQSSLNLPSSSSSKSNQYYAQEITVRHQPNYPQNRVVITKQKSGRSNSNDVVLEYEC